VFGRLKLTTKDTKGHKGYDGLKPLFSNLWQQNQSLLILPNTCGVSTGSNKKRLPMKFKPVLSCFIGMQFPI